MPEHASDRNINNLVVYPLCRWLSRHVLCCQVHPTAITIISILVRVAVLEAAWRLRWTAAIGWTVLYLFLDCLDGTVARECDMCTPFGARLDHISDKVFLALGIGLITYLCWRMYGWRGLATFGVCITPLIIYLVWYYAKGHIKAPRQQALFLFLSENAILIVPLVLSVLSKFLIK